MFYEMDIYFIFIGVWYFCNMHTLPTSTTFATYFADITAAIPDKNEKFKFHFKTIAPKQIIDDNFVKKQIFREKDVQLNRQDVDEHRFHSSEFRCNGRIAKSEHSLSRFL